MRIIFCSIFTVLAFAGMAQAQGDALIVANNDPSIRDRLTGGIGVLSAASGLERQGFDVVQLSEATAAQMQGGFGQFIEGLDGDTDRVAVILSGQFVHSSSDSYLLPVDGDGEDLNAVLSDGLALSKLLGVLAAYPGQALLILAESENSAVATPFLTGGAGNIAVPQGVTVFRGTAEDVATFARRDLGTSERRLVRVARDRGLEVSGYAPRNWVFLPERDTAVVVPDPVPAPARPEPSEADNRLWATAKLRDDLQSYESYLAAFPEGLHANDARQRVRAIRAEPFRAERLTEEALNLSRDARRDIQRDLSLLDFNPRGIDGIFGPGTRGAIKSWQARNGFGESGYLDREQISRLDGQATRRAEALAEEARQRQAELERLDRSYWQETGALGDVPGLRAYLERYPDGVYAEIAQERLDVIEGERRDRAAARDREAWDAAMRDGRVQAFQDYLAEYPDGAFADQARAQIAEQQRPSGEREAIARAAAQEAALNLNAGARRIAEQRLASLGLKPGEVDGNFDKKTRRAIRRYQEARQLSVTGYLDQATVVRLLAESLLR